MKKTLIALGLVAVAAAPVAAFATNLCVGGSPNNCTLAWGSGNTIYVDQIGASGQSPAIVGVTGIPAGTKTITCVVANPKVPNSEAVHLKDVVKGATLPDVAPGNLNDQVTFTPSTTIQPGTIKAELQLKQDPRSANVTGPGAQYIEVASCKANS